MERLGDFAIEGVLGEGGSAVVHAARGEGGQAIALKVARAGAITTARDRRRFLEEAERLARVDHPAVVRVLSSGLLPDGRPFVAMPRLEGETLASRIERGRMPVAEALATFEALAEGVSALHEAGLVHRDLKPENVLLAGEPPAPVLLDLGIAREVDAPASTTTEGGVVRGTRATMAPERLFGQPASVASDVYELSLVLYVMLVGALPWDDASDVDARLSAASPSSIVAEVPLALSDVILRALSTRVENRPVSARVLARLVREAASAEAPVTTGSPALSRHTRRTAAFAPEARRSSTRASDAAVPAAQSPARPPLRARFAGAGAGLAVAIVVVVASRLPVFAPAVSSRAEGESAPAASSRAEGESVPAASSRAEGESAPAARPAASIALEAPSAAASVIAPPSAASSASPGPSALPELASSSSPPVSASPGAHAAPSATAPAKVVTMGARGACDRYVASACDVPASNACYMAKANRATLEKSTPAKAEERCRGLLERDIAARAQEQLDTENLAKSPACARYLGAACAPHVISLPGGSRLCSGVKAFARARAAEGAPGEAACSAAEIGLPAVLQGLARKPEERPIERPDMHYRFGLGQM